MKLTTCEFEKKEHIGVLYTDCDSEKVLLIDSALEELGLTDYECCPECLTMSEFIRLWTPDLEKKLKSLISDNTLSVDVDSETDSIDVDSGTDPDKEYDCRTFVDAAHVKLLAPIPRPEQDIICLGLNYAEHAVEAKHFDNVFEAEKSISVYFSKRATYCPGPDAPIPSHQNLTEKLDYECELAVIIGKDAVNVKPEDVEKYIFGYTIINDVSAREVQTGHTQWYFGKSLDGFSPMGPVIVTKEEIEFPPKLAIRSIINGEVRQDSNTKNIIHDIPEIISELSQGMTLKAGTIIATGTPKGVAMGMDTPVFLKPGDEVVCYIEGIGELKNYIE